MCLAKARPHSLPTDDARRDMKRHCFCFPWSVNFPKSNNSIGLLTSSYTLIQQYLGINTGLKYFRCAILKGFFFSACNVV